MSRGLKNAGWQSEVALPARVKNFVKFGSEFRQLIPDMLCFRFGVLLSLSMGEGVLHEVEFQRLEQ